MTTIAIRLAGRLATRIDRHAKRLANEERGVQFTRSDAIRDLLTQALDVTESKEGPS